MTEPEETGLTEIPKGKLAKDKESKALDKLKGGVGAAVVSLLRLSKHKDAWVRLRASSLILEHYWRVLEYKEMEGRLKTIERIIFEKRTYSNK